jgi:hypothetical protein
VGVTGGSRRRVNQENPPMRIYIIGNDGITLCREAPARVNDGEIAVASNEELHAVALSGKRLLALWNALPGVEKRRKVGDRKALIDQLWSAIQALPEPEPPSDAKRPSKQAAVIAMLQRPEGATVKEVASAMGWQRHTVRGLFSGTLKKKLRLALASAKEERRPGVPHRRGDERMKPAIPDASARQHSGGPSSILGRGGNRNDHARIPGLSDVEAEITGLLDRSTQELRLVWR